MALSLRFYLFLDDSPPLALSTRLVEGLTRGSESLPQFANTRQKVLEVVLDNSDGTPTAIVRTGGHFFDFNSEGSIGEGLAARMRELWDLILTSESTGETVVSITPAIKRKQFEAAHRWTAAPEQIQVVAADIWPKQKSDRLEMIRSGRRQPKLTYPARRALEQCSEGFWNIGYEIEKLRAADLPGFSFEARKRAASEGHPALYEALAVTADRRAEMLAARKRKSGTWVAWVSMTRWDDSHVGEQIALFHEVCNGRAAAESAAKRLLATHSTRIAYDVSVEGGVETALEWDVNEKNS